MEEVFLLKDMSNGYEAVANEFMAARSTVGRAVVQRWAASLPHGGSVLDVGAGSGEPLTSLMIDMGLSVSAIDASPKMVAAFRQRFPGGEIACEAAEHSQYFNRQFDAALAIGLVFLLSREKQRAFIPRLADALNPEGRLLFSAPRQICNWNDVLTDRPSLSLGGEEYERILTDAGMRLVSEYEDEAGNHYYNAQKIRK